jgi:phage FluMu protein Com
MRYKGEPKRLYEFMDHFFVHCPACNDQAEVQVPHFLDYKNAHLTCKSCHFSEKMENRKRYVLTGKAKCQYCLEWLDLEIEGKKKIPRYVDIKCSGCLKINRVNENWNVTYLKYHNQGIIDPAFGLPLWLVGEIKGDTIWAYNLSHLKEIQSYVSSKLRERTTDRFKMTMVERLPDFIKKAKNRDEILRVLERLAEK